MSETAYKVNFVNRLRSYLIKKKKIDTAIVLNFNRRVNEAKVEKSLNHLHACVNRKLLGKRKWKHNNNRVKFYAFREEGANQTHINLLVDTMKHYFEVVYKLIEFYWRKITKQTESALYRKKVRGKEKWVRYASKDLIKYENFYPYA